MSHIEYKKALITGGASGIGKIMGRILLEKGLGTLVIWDINETMLLHTVEEFKALGYTVKYAVVDVIRTEAMLDAANQLTKEIRIILKGIVSKELTSLSETLEKLEPKDRAEMIIKLFNVGHTIILITMRGPQDENTLWSIENTKNTILK